MLVHPWQTLLAPFLLVRCVGAFTLALPLHWNQSWATYVGLEWFLPFVALPASTLYMSLLIGLRTHKVHGRPYKHPKVAGAGPHPLSWGLAAGTRPGPTLPHPVLRRQPGLDPGLPGSAAALLRAHHHLRRVGVRLPACTPNGWGTACPRYSALMTLGVFIHGTRACFAMQLRNYHVCHRGPLYDASLHCCGVCQSMCVLRAQPAGHHCCTVHAFRSTGLLCLRLVSMSWRQWQVPAAVPVHAARAERPAVGD